MLFSIAFIRLQHLLSTKTTRLPVTLTGVLLAACTQIAANPSDAAAPYQPAPPAVENETPFPDLTLTGVDKFGEYTSLALKITYAIASDGSLVARQAGQEAMIDEQTPHEDNYRCKPHGAGFNQRTTWFPDTGIFVSGATLAALKSQDGKKRPLETLTAGDQGVMAVTGPHERELEYGYVPCVGEHRVKAGARTVGYVRPGDRLTLIPSGNGQHPVTLGWPLHPRPLVRLEFAGRSALAIVPANLVLLTVDWPQRRAVAQYQVTVAITPRVSRARWMVLLPSQALDQDPVAQQMNDDMARYIQTCPPPGKPMDPCANPHGQLPESLMRKAPARELYAGPGSRQFS